MCNTSFLIILLNIKNVTINKFKWFLIMLWCSTHKIDLPRLYCLLKTIKIIGTNIFIYIINPESLFSFNQCSSLMVSVDDIILTTKLNHTRRKFCRIIPLLLRNWRISATLLRTRSAVLVCIGLTSSGFNLIISLVYFNCEDSCLRSCLVTSLIGGASLV